MLASPFAIGFSYQNLQTTENSNEANVPSDLHSAEEKQEEVQVWTEPTCKTFEDYFTDKGITAATITEEDFYGSGTMSDPYVINSSNGMWYFRNTALCRTNFVDKYVELGCDIILNEEIYDENGYIQGGDGVVYSWTEDSSSWFKNFYFEGNGFTISGLYFNDDEKNFVSLFGAGNPKRVTNLIMSNYYIVAEQYAAAVAYCSATI